MPLDRPQGACDPAILDSIKKTAKQSSAIRVVSSGFSGPSSERLAKASLRSFGQAG
jgi:hypothetical protein